MFAYQQGPYAHAFPGDGTAPTTDWKGVIDVPRDVVASEAAERQRMQQQWQNYDDQTRLHSYLYPGAPLQQVPGSSKTGDFSDRLL